MTFNCGLKAYKKNVVKSIEVHGEMHRYIPVIAKWAGFSNISKNCCSSGQEIRKNKIWNGTIYQWILRFTDYYICN